MRNERISGADRSRQGSRTGRNSKSERSSFRSSKNDVTMQTTRDIEFAYDLVHTELQYPVWWSFEMLVKNFRDLPECTCWNCYICIIALAAIVWAIIGYTIALLDIVYNVSYAVHVLALCYNAFAVEGSGTTFWEIFGFLLDLMTFSHYVNQTMSFMMFCYYLRLHRPFRYLFALIEFNLKGSVWGTTAKYCYIFLVLRITWAFIWLHLDELEGAVYTTKTADRTLHQLTQNLKLTKAGSPDRPTLFLSALYLVNKMFIPIGPSVPPKNDIERIACLLVMMTGCLVVTGFAVASLSLVISLYMRPEETFRARYRLIIKEMKESHIPPSQRDKVETFYKMYWHKQRAVSATRLLPTFPPTLPATIYMDIYFEATQKSRILRDLTYEFLSEVAKTMETIHYIPGDAIIKRTSMKSSIIYITYGDIERDPGEFKCYIEDNTVLLFFTGSFLVILRKVTDQQGPPYLNLVSDLMQDDQERTSDTTRRRKHGYFIHQMVTPEDDLTAILRMTRGTVLTPCGAATPAGFGHAHLQVRAATFCTAHVLNGRDLWKVAVKYGRDNEQAAIILASFNEHLERVKKHYNTKIPEEAKHKSSILHFKRCLVALKEAKSANGSPLMCRTDFFLEVAGCYMMRNRADSSLTDEADAICLRPTFPCILQPTSSLQFAWHFFVACLTVAVCFIHPYYLVYKKKVPIEFRFFDYMVTAIYILDLIVHLSTGDNVEEGVPITFAQTSSQQMKSPWFATDVFATLPIFEFIGSGHFAGINKILKVAKVFRVLHELEVVCVYNSNVLRFLSYTLLLMIACYLIAALQQGFMCFQFGYCLVTNLTHPPYWENKPLDEETIENRLTFGLYWAISMIMFTTHMETWGTENWFNVLYTMMILEICIVLRIFMEAVYSATIMVTTFLREDYDACISIVKSFLIRNQVDPILRQRFITYLQLCWFTDKAYSMTNRKNIFYDLPSHVYQDIVAKQRSKYILCIPFMKFLHKEDLKNISSNARLFYTSPNEILLNTGDLSNEIYVIKQGICEILSPDTKSTVNYLSVKCHFGVIVCLLRIPAYYTVRAVTHVQVISISRKYLLQAIEVPHVKDALEFLKQQPEFRRLVHRRSPFISYVPPEPTPNTERFRLPRKHELDHAFLQPFYRLGFFSILRYIFPRFTIRPDGRYIIWYECIRAACALTASVVFPAYAYLVLQWPALYYITLLLDLSAYFDILQRMLVGYFNEQGILIYHPAGTAAHYLKGAFITDLFGCLALENLESAQKELKNKYRVTPMKQFLMLNRLIQLYRLPGAMQILHGCIERRDILIVLKAIPLFIVLLNVLTCFMVLYSVDIFYEKEGDWLILPTKDVGGSWINLFKNEFRFNLTASPWNLHLATYFWVVYEATTTGYNIFNPSNFDLMRVLFFGMLIGAMLITYFSVRIISIRANVNKALAEFQEHMKDMVVYMKREKLDEELQKDVLAYYEYTWDKMGGVDYRQVFKLCDQITLRTDAILHIYGPTFAKCPILSQSDASLLRTVGRAVHSAYFLRDMSIIESSDVIADMYFVDYGGVTVRETSGDASSFVKLSRGSVFGNLDGAPTIRCPVTVVATSKVHLLMINSKTFHQIINDFPIVLQLMKKYRPNVNSNYIMGNVGDALKPSRERAPSSPMIVRSRRGLIKHLFIRDTYVQIYLIIVSLLCVYADVYNAGFQVNSFGLIVTLYALDMGFYLKILLQYSLPLIVESTSIRNMLTPLRRAYFQGEFKYDILSCLPIEIMSLFSHRHRWMAFSWLRLNRMFRIITVYKCLKRHQERITINLILSTILSAFIWFTLFVHTISCLWYFIGVMEDRDKPASSWIHKDNGDLWCDNLYLCSLYFVLTTFTQNGVGDIMPKKHSEVVFVCVLQIISTMVYMVYVGEFSNIIQYMSFRSFSFYTKYLELQEFLRNNRVSKNLVKLVNKYCLHLWRESRGVQAPHFLETAPHSLRLRIMSAAYLHHLTRHHVFEDCEPAFLRQLVGCLQIYTYNEDMYVVKASEITDAMYLIHTGKIKEIFDVSHQVSRLYPAGSYFGVVQGLFPNTPYTHSYQTLTKSQVLTLRLDDWLFLLKHFPDSRDAINKHMSRNDSSSGGSGSSFGSWPFYSPKPPRPRVTELIDAGSQPTPPPGAAPTLDSSPTPIFVPPAGPSRDSVSESGEPHVVQTNLWPKNSRHVDTSSSSEQISVIFDDRSSQIPATSQTTVISDLRDADDEHSSFLNKVTSKAKRLMGKPSDTLYAPSLTESSQSQRDVLLEQEDEMATTALIKEYDARKNSIKIDIAQHTLDQVSSEANIAPDKREEKEIASLDIAASKSTTGINIADKDINKEEEETTIDLKMQTDIPDKQTEAPEAIARKDSTSAVDTQDQATSTSKVNRRFVHVRYEEDDENKKRLVSTDLNEIKRPNDLTITERNRITQDSDLHVNMTAEQDAETTSSSTPSSASATSLKKKYNRPSE